MSNFIEQHLYTTGMHVLYLLRNLPGILPHTRFASNRHVLFLSTKIVP